MTETLKSKLSALIPAKRDEVKSVLADGGDEKIADVTVAQAYGGMRGV